MDAAKACGIEDPALVWPTVLEPLAAASVRDPGLKLLYATEPIHTGKGDIFETILDKDDCIIKQPAGIFVNGRKVDWAMRREERNDDAIQAPAQCALQALPVVVLHHHQHSAVAIDGMDCAVCMPHGGLASACRS